MIFGRARADNIRMPSPFSSVRRYAGGLLALCALSLVLFVICSRGFDEFWYVLGVYVLWRFFPHS